MREINKMKKFSIVFAIMLLGILSLSADNLTSYNIVFLKNGMNDIISSKSKLIKTDKINTQQEKTEITDNERFIESVELIDIDQMLEFERYLLEQVPEIINVLKRQAARLSAVVSVQCMQKWHDVSDAGYPGKRYASVWITERHIDGHELPMEIFYVSEDMEQVLWWNRIDGVECLTLEEWRASEHYDKYRNYGASELG